MSDLYEDPEVMAIVEQAMAEEAAIAGLIPVAKSPKIPGKSKRKGSRRNEPPEDAEDKANEKELAKKLPVLTPAPIADIPEESKKLINLLQDGEAPKYIYDQIVLEMAHEAMHLKHLREAAQGAGVPFNKISRDLVAALKEIADIMAAKSRDELLKGSGAQGSSAVNFHTPEFKRVFKYFVEQMMASAASAGIPSHLTSMFISHFQQRMNGFENKATELYTGSATAADKARERLNSEREV